LEKIQKGMPFRADLGIALLDIYYETERHVESVRLCDTLLAKGYTSAWVYFRKGRAETALRWYRKARASLEIASRKDPADETIRSYLDHVAGMLGQGNPTLTNQPIEPVAIPPRLLLWDPKRQPPQARAHGAFYVHRIHAVSFRRDRDQRTTEYRLVKILDRRGVSQFSSFAFPFDPHIEAIYLNDLVVKDENGRILTRGRREDTYALDQNADSVASQKKTFHVPIPGLRPGCLVELRVTRRTLEPPKHLWFSSYALVATCPVNHAAVFFEGDQADLRVRTSKGVTAGKAGGGLFWEVRNPVPFRDEPMAVAYPHYVPMVYLADSHAGWSALARDYLGRMSDHLVAGTNLKSLATEMTRGSGSLRARTSILTRYVQKTLTYKAIAFGRRAMIPNRGADILRHRYGDCKDHALLLHLLLKAANVPSHLALVSTYAPIRPDMPSLSQFNHMILFVPGIGDGVFLDPTDKGLDLLNGPPLGLVGHKVLILDLAKPWFGTVPPAGPKRDRITVRRSIMPSDDGSLLVEETLCLTGSYASGMRGYLRNIPPPRRGLSVQNLLSPGNSDIQVKTFRAVGFDDVSRPLALEMTYRLARGTKTVGDRLVVTIPAYWERYYIEIPYVKDRISPWRWQNTLFVESHVILRQPVGYRLAPGPTPRREGTWKDIGWTVTATPDAGSVNMAFRFHRTAGRFSAADYEDAQNALNKCLTHIGRDFIFEKRK
jgi:hypothetical protein